jgi:hypothetical protein
VALNEEKGDGIKEKEGQKKEKEYQKDKKDEDETMACKVQIRWTRHILMNNI